MLEGRRKTQRNKSKRTYRRKNIDGNFREAEDIFMKKLEMDLLIFESPFKSFSILNILSNQLIFIYE